MKQTMLLLTFAVFGLTACEQKQTTEIRDDFKKYYDQFEVKGSFLLYDQQKDKYLVYNQAQTNQDCEYHRHIDQHNDERIRCHWMSH